MEEVVGSIPTRSTNHFPRRGAPRIGNLRQCGASAHQARSSRKLLQASPEGYQAGGHARRILARARTPDLPRLQNCKCLVIFEVMPGREEADNGIWRDCVKTRQTVSDGRGGSVIMRRDEQIAGWDTWKIRVKALMSSCQTPAARFALGLLAKSAGAFAPTTSHCPLGGKIALGCHRP
jgi:hypothetical protein